MSDDPRNGTANSANVATPGDDERDALLLRNAARHLDAETDALDLATRSALARARANAAEARRRQWLSMPWLVWGGAGMGVALAASLTALVILPAGDHRGSADTALAGMLAAQGDVLNDVALVDDGDAALADDLAFVAWLEENHDAH